MNLLRDTRASLAVEFVLLLPVIILLLYVGLWSTINAWGLYNSVKATCDGMAVAMAELTTPIALQCTYPLSPSIPWPF